MKRLGKSPILSFLLVIALFASCSQAGDGNSKDADKPLVFAAENFLADLVIQVGGTKVRVQSLMPLGVDPHAFEPSPRDIEALSGAAVFFVNGGGFEEWLEDFAKSASGSLEVVELSKGLSFRERSEEEEGLEHHEEGEDHDEAGEKDHHHHHEQDPHFWLDPLLVLTYVDNARDGLARLLPGDAAYFGERAEAYKAQLRSLHEDLLREIAQVSAEKRLLVTDHDTLGYFADRYGFKVVGAVVPNLSSAASPSAKDLADLIDVIKRTGTKAIFLENAGNPALSEQIARETGARVIGGLYTHSLSDADGPASDYLSMMRYDADLIVRSLR